MFESVTVFQVKICNLKQCAIQLSYICLSFILIVVQVLLQVLVLSSGALDNYHYSSVDKGHRDKGYNVTKVDTVYYPITPAIKLSRITYGVCVVL